MLSWCVHYDDSSSCTCSSHSVYVIHEDSSNSVAWTGWTLVCGFQCREGRWEDICPQNFHLRSKMSLCSLAGSWEHPFHIRTFCDHDYHLYLRSMQRHFLQIDDDYDANLCRETTGASLAYLSLKHLSNCENMIAPRHTIHQGLSGWFYVRLAPWKAQAANWTVA